LKNFKIVINAYAVERYKNKLGKLENKILRSMLLIFRKRNKIETSNRWYNTKTVDDR